jgi:spore coat protein CotH
VLADVGLRIKGEASFRRLSQKPAFKIKFDEFVDKQSFRGLRRLTLNNMAEDPSFVAERLGYHLFRAAKLPAPRCNSAVVYVNGKLYGIYANIETEDKTFLRRHFTDDSGNLYEEGQVDFVPGAEAKFDLETNEPKNDRSDLRGLIAALGASTPATFLTDIGKALDTGHFLKFTAAEAATNQWDMYGYTVFYPNNFRLYHDPATAKFVFLPWGMDMSMKPYRDSGKPHIGIFEIARQYDRRTGPVTAGLIFQRCLQSPACKSAYAAEVARMADTYQAAGLEAVAQKMYQQIKPHIMADTRREYTLPQFESAFASVLRTIRERPAAMRADLK